MQQLKPLVPELVRCSSAALRASSWSRALYTNL